MDEILYADDTLIFGANTHCINRLLHTIEGLKLNYDKCVNLSANQCITSVRFAPEGPAAGRLTPRQKIQLHVSGDSSVRRVR